MENHKIISKLFEFCFIMGNPSPTPNPMGTGMGKKSPRLLNGNRDEKALPNGEQTRCYPYFWRLREHGSGGALGGEHGSECGGTMAAAQNCNEWYQKGT
jgi:hypothetical protein